MTQYWKPKGLKYLFLTSKLNIALAIVPVCGMLYGCQKEDKQLPKPPPSPVVNYPPEYVVNMSALPEHCAIDTANKVFTARVDVAEQMIKNFFLSGKTTDPDLDEWAVCSFEVAIQDNKIRITLNGYDPTTDGVDQKLVVYTLNRVHTPIESNNPNDYNSFNLWFEWYNYRDLEHVCRYMWVHWTQKMLNSGMLRSVPEAKDLVVIALKERTWHKSGPGFEVNMQHILWDNSNVPIELADRDGNDPSSEESIQAIENILSKYPNAFFMLEINLWYPYFWLDHPDTDPFRKYLASLDNVYVSAAEWPYGAFEYASNDGQCKIGLHSVTSPDKTKLWVFSDAWIYDVQLDDPDSFLLAWPWRSTSEASALNAPIFAMLGKVLQSTGYNLSKSSFDAIFVDKFFEDAYYAYPDHVNDKIIITDNATSHSVYFPKFFYELWFFNLNPAITQLQTGQRVALLEHDDWFTNQENLIPVKEFGMIKENGKWFFDYDLFVNQGWNPEWLSSLEDLNSHLWWLFVGEKSSKNLWLKPVAFWVGKSIDN